MSTTNHATRKPFEHVTLETIALGQDRIVSSFRASRTRSLAFVRRRDGAIAITTVEVDVQTGAHLRVLAATLFSGRRFEELDHAVHALARDLETTP